MPPIQADKGGIAVIKFEGNNDVLVWKHQKTDFFLPSTLIVHESQEAVFFRNGYALDLFGAGDHQLKTENLPLLNKFVNLPTNGESPFHCEVYFVNKVDSMNIMWGTPSPMQINDPKYNVILPIGANGQFTIRVEDSRKLLVKLVGTINYFDHKTLLEYFRGILLKNIKELISKQLVEKKVTLLEINNYLTEMSDAVKERLIEEFRNYGLLLQSFSIIAVHIPPNDPSYVRLKDALAKKAEMDIVGYNYAQERTYGVLDRAASNEGGGASNIMGAGIGLGMGVNLGGAFGNAMGNAMSSVAQPQQTVAATILCPNCNSPLPADAKFCYKCGNKIVSQSSLKTVSCPKCHAEVPEGAFCISCGAPLKKVCPKCGTELLPDAIFCRICGEKL